MALGRRVRYYRQKLKLTLEQLSQLSGVDVGTISALEQRDSRKSQFSADIACALGLTVEQLVDESQDHLPGVNAHPWSANAGVTAPGAPHAERTGPDKLSFSVAEPPPAQYARASWPFVRITPRDYARLTPEQRGQVEGFVSGLLLTAPR